MANGARRFLLPPVPAPTFVRAVEETVRANAAWVPPHGRGALYVRPLLLGTGADLGVGPSSEATFCVYASPVGTYFVGAGGNLRCIRLCAVRGFARAAQGGCGHIKAAGNYAPAFWAQRHVKSRGYDDVLCLESRAVVDVDNGDDDIESAAVEEAGASNVFAYFRHNHTLVTPSLSTATILPGVTRASIMELAERECDCTVLERRLTLGDLRDADEAFCVGTGASVTPIGSVTLRHMDDFDNNDNVVGVDLESSLSSSSSFIVFGDGCTPGPLTKKLYDTLLAIQTGTDTDLNERYSHWIHVVEP